MTPASLIVTRDSVAVASGGVQVDFKKVSFHYATVQGYPRTVVTWSMHGLTYALVSQETNQYAGILHGLPFRVICGTAISKSYPDAVTYSRGYF